jgi:hypothetical protein
VDGTCEIAAGATGPSMAARFCGAPAVALAEYGCVHEHAGRELVCARHLEALAGGAAGCAPCWLGPPHSRHESHRCLLLARVIESDEEDEPGLVG